MSENDIINENVRLKAENAELKKMLDGYEKLSQLSAKERINADKIIKMYEQIIDFSRNELKNYQMTSDARESVSLLGRKELLDAMEKIQELEKENSELRKEITDCNDCNE